MNEDDRARGLSRKMQIVIAGIVILIMVIGVTLIWRPYKPEIEITSDVKTSRQGAKNAEDRMFLETITVGPLETNCFIIASEETKEAMVIDPGGNAGMIMDTVSANDLNVKYIVLTHAHWDHFGAAAEVKQKTGAQLAIHPLDKMMLSDSEDNLASPFFGMKQTPQLAVDIELEDGQTFKLGDLQIKVLHTPGHSPGGVSLLVGDAVFAGDLLFNRSIGRTDFNGGSFNQLVNSVNTKIFTLPDHVKVYPGHGPATTVGEERRENPYLS